MKTFTLAIRITTVVALSLLMVQCGNKQAAPNQSVSDDTTISSYGDKLPIAYINDTSISLRSNSIPSFLVSSLVMIQVV